MHWQAFWGVSLPSAKCMLGQLQPHISINRNKQVWKTDGWMEIQVAYLYFSDSTIETGVIQVYCMTTDENVISN